MLAQHPDVMLDLYVDSLIAKIAAAQEPDGYLYPSRGFLPPEKMERGGKERWERLGGSQELYAVGHLYEAAVAHYQATGKRTLLDVVVENLGRAAIQCGPIVYCVEAVDNDGHVQDLILPNDAPLETKRAELLDGVTIITGPAKIVRKEADGTVTEKQHSLIAIPYYAWAHRAKGEMAVWLPTTAAGCFATGTSQRSGDLFRSNDPVQAPKAGAWPTTYRGP